MVVVMVMMEMVMVMIIVVMIAVAGLNLVMMFLVDIYQTPALQKCTQYCSPYLTHEASLKKVRVTQLTGLNLKPSLPPQQLLSLSYTTTLIFRRCACSLISIYRMLGMPQMYSQHCGMRGDLHCLPRTHNQERRDKCFRSEACGASCG